MREDGKGEVAARRVTADDERSRATVFSLEEVV